MAHYEVELRVNVRVDDGGDPLAVVSDVVRQMGASSNSRARILERSSAADGDFTLELDLTAGSPIAAAVAGTVLLHEAAERSHVLSGSLPAGPWRSAIRELGVLATESPSRDAELSESDTTALTF